MDEIVFEIVKLDNDGSYYDLIGERLTLIDAIADVDNYKLDNPNYKYGVYKVTRQLVKF